MVPSKREAGLLSRSGPLFFPNATTAAKTFQCPTELFVIGRSRAVNLAD
jgi:hypothetical protein